MESVPAGAKVTLSNGLSGITPATFQLPRRDNVVVQIEKGGYEPVAVNVTSQVVGAGAAGMAGNVLVGGLIGAAVDAGTGAMKDLRPNPVRVTLVPVGGGSGPSMEQRLRELERLKTSGLIDEQEHQSRRTEILRKL